MVPRLEELETRAAPAVVVDPVFAGGVQHLEQSLVSLYSGILQSISQAQTLGITPPAGTVQTMRAFGGFIFALPGQMLSWYQTATPQQIVAIDTIFIQGIPF